MLYKKNKSDIHELEEWIDSLGLEPVRNNDIIQRLKKVRFLGTMLYLVDLKHHYSRYDHSIYVAKIANALGKQLRLSSEIRKLVVLMALLHDIGHLPFSHASEVFFRETWGKYHTGHGSRFAYHLLKSLELSGRTDLAKLVKKANALLHGRQKLETQYETQVVHEMFHGALSADTLDGITRASESIGLRYTNLDKIISGFIKEQDSLLISDEVLPSVFDFLKLKKKIYFDYVYSSKGIAAEAMLTRALEFAFSEIRDRADFLSLDDETTLEKIRYNSQAYEIVKRLEDRNLFYSMREADPEKYKLTSDLYNKLYSQHVNKLAVKQTLEKEIIEQLKTSPSQLIFHSNIRLIFWNDVSIQQNLFSLPIPIEKINQLFNSYRSYGQTIDVLFSDDLLPDIKLMSIPKNIIINRIKKPNDINYKVGAIEKHKGAYMTPELISKFISEWAIKSVNDKILDPSSGEGVFLKAAFDRLISLGGNPEKVIKNIFGVETDYQSREESLKNWNSAIPAETQIKHDNFFNFFKTNLSSKNTMSFDAIIGNPPYINFHRFHGIDRKLALELSNLSKVKFSQRVSSWAPYVVCASSLLKEDGRLGMVLPVELLTTDYAKPLRDFLLDRFRSCTFVFFKKIVFRTTQQDVLLLLASNNKPFGIRKIEVDNYDTLSKDILNLKIAKVNQSAWLKPKWSNLLISDQSVLKLVDSLLKEKKLYKLGEIASLSIGQVTGNNSFFLLSSNDVKDKKIHEQWLVPIVSKAAFIPGAIFSHNDFKIIQKNNKKCFLLHIPTTSNIKLDKKLYDYLELGKRLGVEQGYKCRTRWPWYSVPMQQIPHTFLTYMSGTYVRLVLNARKAYSTNTIHNVNFNKNISSDLMKAYVVTFYSSLGRFSMEMIGRPYGGGVLKLEIGEAKKILLPNLSNVDQELITKIANMLPHLDKELHKEKFSIIYEIDELVFDKILGLSHSQCERIKKESDQLTTRRLLRKYY